ncbi:hypothetical protein [Galactobacter valiniphilus]|uniref:Uncharacterized protein n=1 Tax=Galactobacter valiniphilus TaxID=2676122 RepID=A0A399JB07_9MICC|nr:hypothetical protein [Galactobacter valiniphilus]RII42414.1 hypothetical protein DWB68_07635 [Galactobacter valiniphilus]
MWWVYAIGFVVVLGGLALALTLRARRTRNGPSDFVGEPDAGVQGDAAAARAYAAHQLPYADRRGMQRN